METLEALLTREEVLDKCGSDLEEEEIGHNSAAQAAAVNLTHRPNKGKCTAGSLLQDVSEHRVLPRGAKLRLYIMSYPENTASFSGKWWVFNRSYWF